MIARIWHGYTSHGNAEAYEELLLSEVFPSIEKKRVTGYRKISLLKKPLSESVEFITIMLFDNLQSVKDFSGEDYETAYVPDKARAILSDYDRKSQHYEIIHELNY